MGNLFSVKFDAPPPSRPPFHYGHHHKRKQRGSSITSATGVSMASAKTRSMPVSVSYDAQGLSQQTSAIVSTMNNQNGFASSNGAGSTGSTTANTTTTTTTASKPRRASLKMTLKRAYSSASASSNVLTDERRQIVQETWKDITDKTGKLKASLAIFQTLFEACPDLRKVFNVGDVSIEELDTSPTFVRHAGVFANVLDLAVRNVFDLETEVGPILIMFGRRHFYKHQIDFRNEYLTIFAQSISDFIASNLSESFVNNPESTAGWRLFISYIIHKVKEGYDLECIQARKHSAVLY